MVRGSMPIAALMVMALAPVSGCLRTAGGDDASVAASGYNEARAEARKKARGRNPDSRNARRGDNVRTAFSGGGESISNPEESVRRDLDRLRAQEREQVRKVDEMHAEIETAKGIVKREEEALLSMQSQIGDYEDALRNFGAGDRLASAARPPRSGALSPVRPLSPDRSARSEENSFQPQAAPQMSFSPSQANNVYDVPGTVPNNNAAPYVDVSRPRPQSSRGSEIPAWELPASPFASRPAAPGSSLAVPGSAYAPSRQAANAQAFSAMQPPAPLAPPVPPAYPAAPPPAESQIFSPDIYFSGPN